MLCKNYKIKAYKLLGRDSEGRLDWWWDAGLFSLKIFFIYVLDETESFEPNGKTPPPSQNTNFLPLLEQTAVQLFS